MQKKNSTYSDIYTFANAVARVEKFLRREKNRQKRYYEPTRMLYLKLTQKLEECAKLAYQLAGKHLYAEAVAENCKIIEKSSQPIEETISDTAFELMLSSMEDQPADAKPITAPQAQLQQDEFKKKSKKIVSTYLKSCKSLASGVAFREYDQSVNCAKLLSKWIQLRFGTKSNIFRYNPENIRSWIDHFIFAYAYHWKYHLLSKFELDLQDWLESLRKMDCKYPLPAFIYNMESDDDPDMYCAEAIFLERTIKIVIYSDEFYPEHLHSVEQKVLMKKPEYIGLSLDELKSKCVDTQARLSS